MHHGRRVGRLCLVGALYSMPLSAAPPHPAPAALKRFLWHELYDPYTDMKALRYGWARIPSAHLTVVYYWGPDVCGTGGCSVMVLREKGHGYRNVGDISIARAPITVLRSWHHGLPDIGVVCRDSAMIPLWRSALQFDGKAYPGTCFERGARRVAWHAGKVIIPDGAANERLADR